MSNPNPSPETRFGRGQQFNAGGISNETVTLRKNCRRAFDRNGLQFYIDIAEGRPYYETVVGDDGKETRIKYYPTIAMRDSAYRLLLVYGHGKPVAILGLDEEAQSAIGDILDESRKRAALRVRCEQEAKQLPDTK